MKKVKSINKNRMPEKKRWTIFSDLLVASTDTGIDTGAM